MSDKYGPGYISLSDDRKQTVEDLESLGVPNAAVHCNGTHIWVCPYFMPAEDAGRFVEYCKAERKDYRACTIEEIKQFAPQ